MIRSVITTLFTNKTARFAFASETKADLLILKEMIEGGKIKSIVDRVYPMEQTADAHRRVETEQRLGAIVIAIGDRFCKAAVVQTTRFFTGIRLLITLTKQDKQQHRLS